MLASVTLRLLGTFHHRTAILPNSPKQRLRRLRRGRSTAPPVTNRPTTVRLRARLWRTTVSLPLGGMRARGSRGEEAKRAQKALAVIVARFRAYPGKRRDAGEAVRLLGPSWTVAVQQTATG